MCNEWNIGNVFGSLDAFVQGEGKTVTRNAAGVITVQATVSEADNAAECQKQLETVMDRLQGMEVNIAHISCGLTAAQLTPFEHGLGPEAY